MVNSDSGYHSPDSETNKMKFSICTLFLTLYVWILPIQVLSGDVKPRHEVYTPDYKFYHNLTKIKLHIEDLLSKNPGYIRHYTEYESRNGASQFVLRISNFSDSKMASHMYTIADHKPRILLSFGEHAREFLPIESLFHLLTNLTSGLATPRGSNTEAFSRKVLSQIDLFVIVMANPDGRKHIERTYNYCWRGTSVGVDLDRNFEWEFGGKGSSDDPNDEEYRGPYPFSEPESFVFRDLTKRYHFDMFVSFHSGIRQIFLPFADSVSKRESRIPSNMDAQLHLASKIARAAVADFNFGIGYKLNSYPADGTIYDYMSGIMKIPFSYTIEIWGQGDHKGAQCFDLFNPPNENLQKAVSDLMPIYETIFDYVIKWKEQQIHQYFHISQEPAFAVSMGYILLLVVFLLFLLVMFQHKLPINLRPFNRRRVVSLRSLSSTFSVVGGIKIT
ncbi:carboxypeptidase A4-like [Anneissia japonica]|uniref:carboxypeptidase A4-like n=1 Tax=Anneissia japonica TaxID=1529436 RepID=UPI001425708E|nr:carboxypeptidase A4-like [Anneissia japonica]XP_033115950.1 carboxypeptidase A4-like [Anneissia japonica]XP_033115951.1 carboxypeptidase A4-like [Anneissia japonica]